MGIFDKLQETLIAQRRVEEEFYGLALKEVESGIRRDGLWAQALVSSDYDELKAQAHYIKLLAQRLKDDFHYYKKHHDLIADSSAKMALGYAVEKHITGERLGKLNEACKSVKDPIAFDIDMIEELTKELNMKFTHRGEHGEKYTIVQSGGEKIQFKHPKEVKGWLLSNVIPRIERKLNR